jgi:phosphatidylglycerophosphate synthase
MAEQPKIEKIPALIFAAKGSALKVVALTVLDRLVVAVHRAGAGPITIVTEEPSLPELKRTNALAIPVEVVGKVPQLEGRVLLARGDLLVQAPDVRRCLQAGGTLVAREKDGIRELLQVGVVDGNRSLFMSQKAFSASEFPLEIVLSPREPIIEAMGVARIVDVPHAARQATRELWASMKSTADGLVDRFFNRPVGRYLSKAVIHTPISPNMVSIASIIIGVIAALFLAEGSYRSALIGALLFQLSAIVDCVDGDLARILFKESPLGKWIDLAGDQIVHISVFAGIAFGVLRNGGGKETVWLGLSAILGALISFAVVLRGMREPAGANGPLQKLIDAATNRDFSVIVLALALVQKLHWFLWMAGIGSHLFWITALGLQIAPKPQKVAEHP